MVKYLVGKKCGMTRVFTDGGASLPVTIVEVSPNKVTQVKTLAKEGYNAIQVTTGHKKLTKVCKPLKGHYAKNSVEPGLGLWEFRFQDDEEVPYKVGGELTIALFNEGNFVDVCGVSKGKGFAGVIKRHNFSCQDATHGNSLSHRAPGSIGQRQTPGRVFKNKKMAGHLGCEKCTILSQKIVKVDIERNLLFIRGAIPGAPQGIVIVKSSVKKRGKDGN